MSLLPRDLSTISKLIKNNNYSELGNNLALVATEFAQG